MAFSPIAFIAPNYRDFKTYWLKAYEPGTTTPKVMALESDGGTQVSKLELNVDGFLVSAGDALVIPYIDGAYDAYLFPTETEADNNITTNAERVADNITGVNGAILATSIVTKFDVVNDPIIETNTLLMFDGASLDIKEYALGTGGGAMWDVVLASSVTPNTFNIVQCTGIPSLAIVLRQSPFLTIEMYGAIENTNSSGAIRAAIADRGAKGIIVPAKRYLYDRTPITDDVVYLIGEKSPNIKSDFTTLENGSIIQGTMIFSGKNITVKNIGFDLGSATSEADGDGLKCSTTLNAGVNLCIDGVTTLLPSFDTAQHSMLLESYTKCYLNNITTGHGDFSLVIKCSNITGGNFNLSRSRLAGLYLKSDPIFGTAENINLTGVIVDGNELQQGGLLIQTDDVEINNVNIDNAVIKNCDYGVFIDAALTASDNINDITLSDFTIQKPLIRGVWSRAANAGIIKSLTLNTFNIKDIGFQSPDDGVNTRAAYFEGDHKILNINGFDAIPNFGTNAIAISDFIHVDTAVKTTIFNNINVTIDYDGTSDAALGYINYLNNSAYNRIGIYRAYLKGVGRPLEGVSNFTVLATPTDLPVSHNTRQNTSLTRASFNVSFAVDSFDAEIVTGVQYPDGYILNVNNSSAGGINMTINNFTGNILNTGGGAVVLLPNECTSYVKLGSNWHQVG